LELSQASLDGRSDRAPAWLTRGFAMPATLRGAGINVMVVEQSGKVGAS
jgi:hypothetical protein